LGTISRYNNLAGTARISTTSYTYDAIDRITNPQHQAAGGTNISDDNVHGDDAFCPGRLEPGKRTIP
jgi:hypothetical protein